MARISVKNGGPSRKGEKEKDRKTPRTKQTINRYAGSRKLENLKRRANRKVANIELSKEGLYTCKSCFKVKPEEAPAPRAKEFAYLGKWALGTLPEYPARLRVAVPGCPARITRVPTGTRRKGKWWMSSKAPYSRPLASWPSCVISAVMSR